MSDILFHHGHLFTGRRHRPHSSVLVRDGRVVAVGDPERVRQEAGVDAELIDIGGGLLLPGFFDSHMHPMMGGLERRHCDLSDLGSPDEYATAISEAAGLGPVGRWFRGGGWSVDQFDRQGPTAADLDALVPHRPAFLPSADHHDAWVNTRALEIAGITRSMPDPADGWIERDAQGHPTGTLREGAMDLVWATSTPPGRSTPTHCGRHRPTSTPGASPDGTTP